MLNQNNSFLKYSVSGALEELKLEREALQTSLNKVSGVIREAENGLREGNLGLSFSFPIAVENTEILNTPKEGQFHDFSYPVEYYHCKKRWSLSWEKDMESKQFRLFLIEEETEEVCYKFNSSPEKTQHTDLPWRLVSRVPFIETKIQIRIKYSEYLAPFLGAFKEYLKKCRLSLEEGDLFF